MSKPIVISVIGDTKDLVNKLGQGESKLSRLGGVAGKVGAGIAAGVAVGAVALGGLALSSVKAASDAQQSLGATETVFGRYADTVIKHSDRAARSVGLSANEYRTSANLIGSLFKNQGVAADQLAGKTNSMVKLGADLAATFGGPTSGAVEALGSAFKGEFDPLERFGISLKQSTITAELARRGQDKLTGSALAQAKQQATTSLIMRQAKDSLGAFGRESGTLANQQQKLGASWDNIKAKVGTALLPVLTKLATFANDKLLPGLAKLGPPLASFFGKLGATLGPIITKIGAGIAAAMPYFQRFAAAVIAAMPAVRSFIGAIASRLQPVITQIVATFRAQVLPTIQRVAPTLIRIGLALARTAGKFLVMAATVTGRVLPPLIRFAGFIFARVVPALVRNVSAIARVIGAVVRFGTALVRGGLAVVRFAIKVNQKIGDVVRFFAALPGRVLRAVGNLGSLLLNAGKNVVQGLIDGITSKIGAVRDKLSQLTSMLPSWKGPPARDKKLLTPAGQSIIQGLIDGFDKKTPAVRRALGVLSRDISTFDASPSASLVALPRARTIAAGSAMGGSAGGTLHVKITAEQATAIQRGRAITLDIAAYRRAGGQR